MYLRDKNSNKMLHQKPLYIKWLQYIRKFILIPLFFKLRMLNEILALVCMFNEILALITQT